MQISISSILIVNIALTTTTYNVIFEVYLQSYSCAQ